MSPRDVITIYTLIAPVVLCAIIVYLLLEQRPQINIHFPNILLCGRVDNAGTTIDIPGNGALIAVGKKLKPGAVVYLVEVKNG